MNYYAPKSNIKNPVKLTTDKVLSAKDLALLFGFDSTSAFTRSAFCKKEFIQYKPEKNVEVNSDGYSKFGLHVPKGYNSIDHAIVTNALLHVIKKFKVDRAFVILNIGKLNPTTLHIKLGEEDKKIMKKVLG